MKNAFQLCTSCPIFPYIKNDKGNMTKKVGLKSHSDVYRVRRRPAYSLVTPFLILAKQGAAAPFDNLISRPRKIEIEIHKQRIKRVTDYKYLGIIFDFNMKWDKHI